MNDIASGFFKKNWRDYVCEYTRDPITYNAELTLEWLSTRPNANAKALETIELISGMFLIKPISNIKFHIKLEALLKDDPIEWWE